MYRKVLITGVTAAAIIGAGGTALAVSGSDTPSGTPSGSSSAKHDHHGKQGKHGKHGKLLRKLSHGAFVVKGKDGKFVTHDLIKGTATSVSATSITVQAADKTSETFAVTKDTKVRVRAAGKGVASSITKIAKGDPVLVAGTGTSTLTAKHVVDVKGKKTK